MKRANGHSFLGPTGKFPLGQMNDDDEGELKMGVWVDRGKIILAFGKEVSWVGMDRNTALALARMIKQRAKELP